MKLLEIQKEIGAIKKESENPFFHSAYFDINALLKVVKPVLNKHGIVLLQGLTNIEGKLALDTRLIEDDKVIAQFTCPIPDCADAQKYGSAITYFRRYALQSLLALESVDDDANLASTPKNAVKGNFKPSKPISEEESLESFSI